MESNEQMSDNETFLMALHMAGGTILPMVLKATIELGVFDIIAGESLSPAEIAAKLPECSNSGAGVMLDRMLRLLACCSVVQCSLRPGGEERLYGLNSVSKLFTKNQDGVSFAPLCLMNQDKVYMKSWYNLKDAILDGGVPFNKAYGMSELEYRKNDPRLNNIFNHAMSDDSTITMKKFLDTYTGFEGLNTLVNIGGGTGDLLSMIVSKYPSIRGFNFDLAHFINNGPTYPEHVSGDMFESVPRGDAILMKTVLHDWSDEDCLKILKKCHEGLAENGKVIAIECHLPEAPDSSLESKSSACMDLIMFAHNLNGRERTASEYETLAMTSGFKGFRIACKFLYFNVMEFLKN